MGWCRMTDITRFHGKSWETFATLQWPFNHAHNVHNDVSDAWLCQHQRPFKIWCDCSHGQCLLVSEVPSHTIMPPSYLDFHLELPFWSHYGRKLHLAAHPLRNWWLCPWSLLCNFFVILLPSTHNDNVCIFGKLSLFQSKVLLMLCESISTPRRGVMTCLTSNLSPSVCQCALPAKWRDWFHDIPEDESYVGIQTETFRRWVNLSSREIMYNIINWSWFEEWDPSLHTQSDHATTHNHPHYCHHHHHHQSIHHRWLFHQTYRWKDSFEPLPEVFVQANAAHWRIVIFFLRKIVNNCSTIDKRKCFRNETWINRIISIIKLRWPPEHFKLASLTNRDTWWIVPPGLL